MKVSEYLVDYIVSLGVTDVFGIPGGVILDLLYAFKKNGRITPHLSYHEQGAAFEACGYAQYEHRLGVAYATRGPGFTNLITGIADAYADSIPVLFITAHSGKIVSHNQRFEKDQEMDTVSMVQHITKFAKAVDEVRDAHNVIKEACKTALTGRKGPVFIDFSSSLWNEEIELTEYKEPDKIEYFFSPNEVINTINSSDRPIILVGDGVRQADAISAFMRLCRKQQLPVLSSRCSQDIGVISDRYYGYVGSHGIRYSNFIFAKADCVISIGNRLGFPTDSKSFNEALNNKEIIRVEIDDGELKRKIPNTESYHCDIKQFLQMLYINEFEKDITRWICVCNQLKNELMSFDRNYAIDELVDVFKTIDVTTTICCDVGNNEFWVSRAYVEAGIKNRILYSKSYGALGCGIPKSIGAYYATRKPVLCIVGDQGFQLNLQELQQISKEKLPICILVVNNSSSGMIRSREKNKFSGNYLHTTYESGYGMPDIKQIARAYGIEFADHVMEKSSIVELIVDVNIDLEPCLPAGNAIQNMYPQLDGESYRRLDLL